MPIDAQSIDAPLSQAAVFLVITVANDPSTLAQVCTVLGGLDDLVKTVGCLASLESAVISRIVCNPAAGRGKSIPSRRSAGRCTRRRRPRATSSFTSGPNAPISASSYLHDLDAWGRVSTPVQEEIIGRTKIDNVEINDDAAPRKSHKSLATIVDPDGNEYDILRDDMPFGRPGHREFGTYFIGYSRYLWVIEKMLQRMYIGEPAASYDRLLDFSKPQTGTTFFAPARPALQSLVQAASSG
nr:Dyp-type peroxidase [Acidisphaera sp. L21]